MDKAGKIIADKYKIEARTNRSGVGYVAAYFIPGTPEHFARYPDGGIEVFGRQVDAEAAAGFHLCQTMNERSRFSYSHGYRKMGGAELAVAIEKLGISPAQLAGIVGTRQTRVLDWIDGIQDIPHTVSLLMALCHVSGVLPMIVKFTNETLIDKEKKIGN